MRVFRSNDKICKLSWGEILQSVGGPARATPSDNSLTTLELKGAKLLGPLILGTTRATTVLLRGIKLVKSRI